MSRQCKVQCWLLSAMLFYAAPSMSAPMVNMDFEQGDFGKWTTSGAASIQDSSFGTSPNDGVYGALLDTSSGGSGMSSFLGISSTELFNLAVAVSGGTSFFGATQGSGIKRTFDINAGETLSFAFKFLTTENTPNYYANDFAVISIPGANVLEAFADTFLPSFGSSVTIYAEESDWLSWSYTFAAAGSYELAIGVFDLDDPFNDSALFLDSFVISGGTGQGGKGNKIPLPSTMWLVLLFGSVLLVRSGKRR